MFVHSVYFWLKQNLEPEDRAEFRRALEALGEIPSVAQVHVGTPPPARREVIEATFDMALTLLFDDEAAHDAYQEHPGHLEFVEKYHRYWERLRVFDAR